MSVPESVCVTRGRLLPGTSGAVLFSAFCLALFSAAMPSRSTAQEVAAISPQAGEIPVEERPGPNKGMQAQQDSSDVLSYWYGGNHRTPFVVDPTTGKASEITRNSIEFAHAGSAGIWSTFADVTVSQSNMAEPAANGGTGATELYAILRPGVSLNGITRSSAFGKGPLRDVIFEAGANLETKNSSYAPAERTLYIGPKLEFAVRRGFFDVGLHFRKEWNHEGVLGKSENYHPDFNIEPTWLIPFALGKLHLAYSGFAEYNTAKGNDSFGSETVGEFLLRNSLAVDIGEPLFGRAQMLDLHGGFWYWRNEYGKPSSDPGAVQMTPIVGVAFHLNGGRAVRRN